MQYFNQLKHRRRSSQIMKPPNPVLTAEDEAFLQQVTSQPEKAPSSPEITDPQSPGHSAESSQQPARTDAPQDIPLPSSPVEAFGKELGDQERKAHEKTETAETTPESAKQDQSTASEKKKKRWSAMFWLKNTDTEKVSKVLRESRFNLRWRRVYRHPDAYDPYREKLRARQAQHDPKAQPLHRPQHRRAKEKKHRQRRKI